MLLCFDDIINAMYGFHVTYKGKEIKGGLLYECCF
jgi:hypothetical protein